VKYVKLATPVCFQRQLSESTLEVLFRDHECYFQVIVRKFLKHHSRLTGFEVKKLLAEIPCRKEYAVAVVFSAKTL
jgi:hypothetical protein